MPPRATGGAQTNQPKLNDLINAFFSWLVDSAMIFIGVTGVPSSLLDGFLNDVFLAFQLIDHFDRRSEMGPYHPGIEQFVGTGSSPYNIETLFTFIEALWDSRGFTCVIATFRNGQGYTYGRDVFRGGLVSIAYMARTKLFTDYVENVNWKVNDKDRDVMINVGDGQALEAPLTKHQRWFTGLQETVHVLSMAPNS